MDDTLFGTLETVIESIPIGSMRRFPTPDPRQPERPDGPFDPKMKSRTPRDPAPIIIAAIVFFLIAVILVLAFAPFSPLTEGSDTNDVVFDEPGVGRGISEELPQLPLHLEAVSDFVVFESGGAELTGITINIPLKMVAPNEQGLRFYSFLNGRWYPIGNAKVIPLSSLGATVVGSGCEEGTVNIGTNNKLLGCADFPAIPANIAVLRPRGTTGHQIVGSLSSGSLVHDAARDLLNIVSPRDYMPTRNGSISGSATAVNVRAEVDVVPTIVANDEDAGMAIAAILSDPVLRTRHVQAIESLVENGGFAGIDLEYTALTDPSLKDSFTEFVADLADSLHDNERILILTLPVAASATAAEPFDWVALGAVADLIKVLPTTDPTTYWQATNQGLAFATAAVPAQKLILGLTPFSQKIEGNVVSPVGYRQAMFLSSELEVLPPNGLTEVPSDRNISVTAPNLDPARGATAFHWDKQAAAVTFSFTGADGPVRIYIENTFSLAFKLELVQAFGLGGIAVGNVSASSDIADIWRSVRDLVEIGGPVLVQPSAVQLSPEWVAPMGTAIETAGRMGTAIWRTPSLEGSYTVGIIVSDGASRFVRQIQVEVMEPITSTAPITDATPVSAPAPTPTAAPAPEVDTTTPTPAPEVDAPTSAPQEELETPVPQPEETAPTPIPAFPTAAPTPFPLTPTPTPTP